MRERERERENWIGKEKKERVQGQRSVSGMLCTNSCAEEHPCHANYANRLESDYS